MRQLKSLSIYGFTIFFNAALSFATFSLVTHHLNEVDYGIINLYNSFSIFIIPFIGVGVQFLLGVDFFKMDADRFRKHFTNAMVIPVISTVFLTILFLIFNPAIQRLVKINLFFVLTLPFSCLLILLNDVILNLIRNKEKHFLFAGFSIFKNVAEIGFTILFVVSLGWAWQGRLTSSLIALGVAGTIIIYLIRKWDLYKGSFSRSEIKKTFRDGSPFVPERLAIFVIFFSDRFFIDHFKTTADVGYYGAGAQIAAIVVLTILTLSNTFHPYLYKKLSKAPVDYKGLRKVTLIFISGSAVVSLIVIAITPLIFKYFVGPAFQPGQKYAIFLVAGLFFWGVYNAFLPYLLNLRKSRLIMFISIAGMIISITGNFINVRLFGALGAAYTSILVYFSMALITVLFVHRYYDLRKLLGRFSLTEERTVIKTNNDEILEKDLLFSAGPGDLGQRNEKNDQRI